MNELIIDIENPKTENNSLHLRLVCIGIKVLKDEDGFSAFNPGIPGGNHCFVIDHNKQTAFTTKEFLIDLFKEYRGRIIGDNLVHDIGVLQNNGFSFPHAEFFDNQIAIRCINENETRIGLKPWGIYLGMKPWWYEARSHWETGDTQDMDLEVLKAYNLGDLEASARRYKYCLAELAKKPQVTSIFRLENWLIPHVARMRSHGFGVDYEEIKKRKDAIEERLKAIEYAIESAAGNPINLRSPKQVSTFLFDKLGLPQIKGRSTDEEVLNSLPKHPVVEMLLEYRGIEKQRSSFLDPVEEISDKEKGILYTDLMIHGTPTTRVISRHPNTQNFPEILRVIFKPRNGLYLWVDLDQLEFKLLIDLAGQEDMIKAVAAGADVHEATALLLFNDKSKRKIAKTSNYAMSYGAGIKRVMAQAGVDYETARHAIDTYKRVMWAVMALINRSHQEIERTGKITSPFGLTFTFPYDLSEADSKSRDIILSKCKREGFNAVIQSTGHLLLLLLWAYLIGRFEEEGILYNGVDWANEVHDELVLDIKPELLQKVGTICHEGLGKLNELAEKYFGYKLKLKITGTVKYGDKWE